MPQFKDQQRAGLYKIRKNSHVRKMATTTFNFATPSNYTLFQTQIDASLGKLTLTTKPLQTFTEDFADDTGFTYDNTKAEFTGGLVRAKDQRPANAVLGATYTSTKDLSWFPNGVVTATQTGTVGLTGGKITCLGGGINNLIYTDALIGAVSQVGSVKLKYTPAYSGTPVGSYLIFQLLDGVSLHDNLALFHSNDGRFKLTLRNTSGTAIHTNAVLGSAWSPVAGTEYEIEFCWDGTGGACRLFIDGVLQGALTGTTFTRGTEATKLYVGASATLGADASYNDVLLFSTVQHTSGYTPGYAVIENVYATSIVTLPSFTYSGLGDMQAITLLTPIEVGAPKYIVDGYYWAGSAWALSDLTYAQASSSSDINANISTLSAFSSPIQIKIIFPDSNILASVANLILTYTGQQYFSSGAIKTNIAISAQEILTFVESHTGTIKFGLVVNDVTYYWTGSAWAISDESSSQLNTAADIAANLATVLVFNSEVQLFCFLSTIDQQTTPEIDYATFTYNFGSLEPGEPATCEVFGYIIGPDNTPLEAVTVFAETLEHDEVAERIMGRSVTTLTDDTGYFNFTLVRSSEFDNAGLYRIVWQKENVFRRISNDFLVPDAASINITSLLT